MFTCSKCHLNMTDRHDYLRHIKIGHFGLTKFPCGFPSCHRILRSVGALRAHIRYKHENNKPIDLPKNKRKTWKPKLKNTRKVTPKIFHPSSSCKPSISGNSFETESMIISPENCLESCTPSVNSQAEISHGMRFAAKFYDYPDIARIRSNEIINDTSKLLNDSLGGLEHDILKVLEEDGVKMNTKEKIKKLCTERRNVLDNFKTEYLCLNSFEKLGTYISPQTYLLGERNDYVSQTGLRKLKRIPVTAQVIPLRKSLKKFLEQPLILDETLNYLNMLRADNCIISNFVQGQLWRELSSQDGDRIVLPLIIYSDDYENNNVLGSHKGISKCCAVYAYIPCLPPRFVSKLENILLFVLFNTLDRKYVNDKVLMSAVEDELKFLEQVGIEVECRSGKQIIFFRLALITGDNLGLHSLLGFSQSFNHKRFCRFCLCHKNEIHRITHENQVQLRNINNYEAELKQNDSTLTGIIAKCQLQSVGGFHPVKNLYVDNTHDILEGVCRYDLALILNYFIKTKKIFDLTNLNERLRGFNYGSVKNVPAEITSMHLTNKAIIMSASEMLTLVRYLPLIIAHKIPEKDDVWQLLLSLKEIIDIVTSYDVDNDCWQVLQVKIDEYLRLLGRIFPRCFKPKHHFLVHYPQVMFLCGPLGKISTIRCEGKHREGKITSKTSISRVNVCKTIAIKHQLRFNYRLINKCIPTKLEYEENSIREIEMICTHGFHDIRSLSTFFDKPPQTIIPTVKKIKIEEYEIQKRDIIAIAYEDGLLFYQVDTIIIDETGDDCIIITKLLHNIFLDEFTQAYKLGGMEYSWTILHSKHVKEAFITKLVRSVHGKYILKTWC
uniref:ZNF687 protein n=1 Tax=Fopius arisanus TaxID=64838 RepID=A0A0C9RNU9_9HYME